MGNALSDSDDDVLNDGPIDFVEEMTEGKDEAEGDSKALTNLCQLFSNNATLRAVASKVKEKIPENVILQHHTSIVTWLDGRLERSEETVTVAQFCDMLMNQSVDRADAIKAFHQFDCDGSGVADVQAMMDAIDQYSSRSALGELGKSTRILQSCSITPAFVDVYAGTSHPVEKHGTRILRYLLRNRSETKALPFPYLNTFNNITIMRTSVLSSMLISNNCFDKEEEEGLESDDLEKRIQYNCYSNIEVSSNSQESRLLNRNTYWQSDGAARSHWIRLHIKSDVVVKYLSIGVSANDQSYMPELVTVSVGHSVGKLHEIKEVKINLNVTGQVILVRNLKTFYPYVQINIRRCHGDGCDTRIHGIKVVGSRIHKEQGVTVLDASALWYLQVLTSLVSFALPQSPQLRKTLLGHTKKALESMPPLSLCSCSPDRPVFLSRTVLQQIETFVSQLAESAEQKDLFVEGLQVFLAINLAEGNAGGLIKLVKKMLEHPTLSLPCADLLSKALATRMICWEKIGTPLAVKCEGSDGGPGMMNDRPSYVIQLQPTGSSRGNSASPNRVYLTDEGKTCCSMIFKSEEKVQLSKIKIHVASGSKGPRQGLVFVYNPSSVPGLSKKFDFDEHIKYFSKYDFWRDKEFIFSIECRESGVGGLPDNPVSFFKFSQDCDEIDVPVKWNAVGQYILVKFLDARNETSTRLGILSIRFFGIVRNQTLQKFPEKFIVPNLSMKKTCEIPDIIHIIITFLTDIAIDQVQRKSSSKHQFEFLDLSDLDVNLLWELHEICSEKASAESSETNNSKTLEKLKSTSLLLLQLIHGLIPVLAVSKGTTEASRDAIFQKLCEIINSSSSDQIESSRSDVKMHIIKQIIIDGAPLFFPEKTKKRDELFKLLKSVSDQSSIPSMSLVFQSLCQFFSSVDPKGLLELPSCPSDDFSFSNALEMMKTLLIVACQERESLILENIRKRETGSVKNKQKDIPASETCDSKKSQEMESKDIATENKHEPKETETKDVAAENKSKSRESETTGAATENKHEPKEAETKDVATENKNDSRETETNGAATENKNEPKETERKDVKEGATESKNDPKETEHAASQDNDDGVMKKEESAESKNTGNVDVKEISSTDSVEEASSGQDEKEEHHLTYLVKLTASLQTAVISWCWQQLDKMGPQSNDKLSNTINTFVSSYTTSVIEKATEFFAAFRSLTEEEIKQLISDEQPVFLFLIARQLNFLLTFLVDKLNIETKVSILHNFKVLVTEISHISKKHPQLFSDISEENWNEIEKEETVLRTWEVESPHEYLNHSNITQVFHCPGASKLVVDFDPQCETERRYDYLEFTDAKGLKRKFDYKVGLPKWPLQVIFRGPFLTFLFHSDSSNTEWGYKFVVTAKGTPDAPLSWMKDLQLGLVKVLGQLCGSTLASNPIPQLDIALNLDESEQDILRSDLWMSLFRGGYMVGKLQRSLSGKFSTGDDSRIHSFMLEVINTTSAISEEEKEKEDEEEESLRKQAEKFLAKCAETVKGQLKIGGPTVDRAIMSIFVTLVWHCQQLREDTDKFLKAKCQGEIPDGIKKAYSTAESLRIQLASERQKLRAEESEAADPAELLSVKCAFLLKFAGLTKVPLKNELRLKSTKHMNQKKEGNKKPGFLNEIMDKYPSFRLVLEFVQDPAWTSERVHQLLQERSKFASALASVYMFVAEMIRIMADKHPFQIPVVLFLQELFTYQDKFAHHYADGLDGCGLQQESQVRVSYYTLVRRLVDAFRSQPPFEKDSCFIPAYDVVLCCLLHLLDVDWQPYDLSFVLEMQLPQLYLNIAKETVKMHDLNCSDQKEEDEMNEYEQAMKWYSDIGSQDINDWFTRKEENLKENKKELKMFIARFSDVLDVAISCDGCSVTLPGRRYRCLQCMDMDLCIACFSGGVEPEEHRDDHEIVHLVFKCNHCQAFIVSTRIHCNQCDDFDLCIGCHKKQKFPAGHTEDHDVTRIPLVKLKTSQSSNSSLKAYIHQHAWLLYTSLTLTLSNIVYGIESGTTPYSDSDYIKMAGQLQHQCITQATRCLDADINGEKEKEIPLDKRHEETFARHSQERIMGLLGAVMPNAKRKECLSSVGFDFSTQEFLNLLLRVAKGEHGHDLNTQHLALRLLGHLLVSSDFKLTDSPKSQSSPERKSDVMNGQEMISHLFSLGTKAFERNCLEWACSVARMLEMLFASPQWKPVINQPIYQCVQNLKQNIDHTNIFPMFVVAGFPEVLTTGTMVNYSYTSFESQSGVILKHFPDKHQALIVDLKTRKRHTVEDKLVSCQMEEPNVWETGNVSKFLSFITNTVMQIRAGEQLSVEKLWVLSLTLKVLNRCFKSENLISINSDIFNSSLIQALVFLACKGTALNHHWLLKDLEVLSLIWYTHDGTTSKKTKITSLKEKSKKDKKKSKDEKKDEEKMDIEDEFGESEEGMAVLETDDDDSSSNLNSDSDDDDDDDDDDSSEEDMYDLVSSDGACISASDSDYDGAHLFDLPSLKAPIDAKAKEFLKSLKEELEIDPTVLEAMWLMNSGSTDDIIKNIIENFGESNENVTKFLEKMKSEPSSNDANKKDSPVSESTIDTGISTHPLARKSHKIPDLAEKETGDSPPNLFRQQEKLAGEIGERMRSKSAMLLKRELKKHGRSGSREYLLKVNMAMCVLYARHTLTGLLAYWPESGPAINSSLLGCRDVNQIPCVLDLLYKVDTRDFFSKVVDRVIHLCDSGSLVPIAYTAAQFMEEVTLSAVTKESSHNYTDSDRKKGNIQLPGATYLTVTFDSRCATSEDDSLIFTTRQQSDNDTHSFSGLSRARWTAFHVPGDTLYYKFFPDDYDSDENSSWGYRFTVTAGTRDSFETGHTILEAVLSSSVARSLPLGQLWSSLVYVACKQASMQRLKAINLMLKVVALQGKTGSEASKTKPDIDLCLLAPLWNLYTSMTEDDVDAGFIQPSVVGALTDLFLHVENLAAEWGMSEEYLVSLIRSKDLYHNIAQGLINIAAVGEAIQYSTKANQMLKDIQSYVSNDNLITAVKTELKALS